MKKKVAVLVGVAVLTMAGMSQAATRFAVQDAAGTSDKMMVMDNGYVGIGTNGLTSLLAPLHIKGPNSIDTQIFVENTGATPYSAQGAGSFTFFRNNAGNALPFKDDRFGAFMFGGKDGANYRYSSAVVVRAETNWVANSNSASYITFETTQPGSVSRSEKLRLTGLGNLGISTTSPTQKIEVNGGLRIYPVTQDATKDTETPTASVRPACTAATRGTMWFVPSATTDALDICVKISGVYAFKAVTLAP